MYYHPPGDPSFYDFVPKELMPKEYGGDQLSCAELKSQCKNNLIFNLIIFYGCPGNIYLTLHTTINFQIYGGKR